MPRRSRRPRSRRELSIPEKAHRILYLTIGVMLVIVARLWHLSVVQHDERLALSRRPQSRFVVERAERGTIRDRFNEPLAMNQVQYNAAVHYAEIKEIPSVKWEQQKGGAKLKRYPRREYIARLATLFGEVLGMAPERVEDLIYSKAALFHQVPYVLRKDISEKQYHRLRMLERDWPGIRAERVAKRIYPRGRLASDVVGYMGAISGAEYRAVLEEMAALKDYLKQHRSGLDAEEPAGIDSLLAARERLEELEERAYTYNDFVGKAGIEASFEEDLRGFYGKRGYAVDASGNFLYELPGARDPVPGRRLLLSISSELQECAEQLLAANEEHREGRCKGRDPVTGAKEVLKQPWVKGGAIVAMDPNNGEVLALATYPRFDPNDFIPSGNPTVNKQKQDNVRRWLELDSYLAGIWDGFHPLKREVYSSKTNALVEEELGLSWETYLEQLFSRNSGLRPVIQKVSSIKTAAEMIDAAETLRAYLGFEQVSDLLDSLYSGENHEPYETKFGPADRTELLETLGSAREAILSHKYRLDGLLSGLRKNSHKLIILDLCRLIVNPDLIGSPLLDSIGTQSLDQYFQANRARNVVTRRVRDTVKQLYHELHFLPWREQYGKTYLRLKRAEERDKGQYQKPYLDYLDGIERKLFDRFWNKYRWQLVATTFLGESRYPELKGGVLSQYVDRLIESRSKLLAGSDIQSEQLSLQLETMSPADSVAYLSTMRTYRDLTEPLYGHYSYLRQTKQGQLLKHLAAGFYPRYGWGSCRSYAFRQAAVQGSVFKLVIAYEALAQQYKRLQELGESVHELNPLTIMDRPYRPPGSRQWVVASFLDGQAIPQIYKGGRLLKSLSRNIGETDLYVALERSSNPYFSLLAGDFLDEPEDVNRAAFSLGFGQRTGIALPDEISGRLPDDISENRSGLYAYAVGQHSLVVTPLQTAVMVSAIANGGTVFVPSIVSMVAGREPRRGVDTLFENGDFAYRDALASVGVDFPLFTKADGRGQSSRVERVSADVHNEVFMPPEVRSALLKGMERVVKRHQSVGRVPLLNAYQSNPQMVREYTSLERLVGKSSTAEAVEFASIDRQKGGHIYNHVWFGGISFAPPLQNAATDTLVLNDRFGRPELVVVVYLRFGGMGSETAPIAGQIVKKWREIKARTEA